MQKIAGLQEKEKIVFIINPVSGASRHSNPEEIIRNNIDTRIFQPVINKTRYRGHASNITRKWVKKGAVKIVAVGGDGTVNEIASVLVGTKCLLGIIPNGSGNGLARYLKIPSEPVEAVKLLNRSKSKKIDVGKINKHLFFCTCGIGFDAHIGKMFDRNIERGFKNYVRIVLREFFTYRSKIYNFEVDGKKYAEKAFLLTFANAGQYGSDAYISPDAKIDDGLLDICVFRPFPKFKSLFLGLRLFNRTIDRSKYLQVIRGRKIKVIRKKKTNVHIDGEPIKLKKNLKIKILPKALRVMVSS